MFTKNLVAASLIALALSAVGCGDIKDLDGADALVADTTPACAPSVRLLACPPGFPAGQHVCTDMVGQPVSGCQLTDGAVCAPACRRN